MSVYEIPLMSAVIQIARQAGQVVMEVYESDGFEVMLKTDQSPLTQADLAAHRCIVDGLSRLLEQYPVVSEEDDASHAKGSDNRFWLIDPLDGTKEFIARSDEFTINIALIEHGEPILGVVFAPALDLLYCGMRNMGAALIRQEGITGLHLEDNQPMISPCRVVASKNHLNQETQTFIDHLGEVVMVQAGSSLKICRVAEGMADIYPRMGPTSEWDTAAAHAILTAAGGVLVDLSLQSLRYGKAQILNPYFIATTSLAWIPSSYLHP